MSGFYSLGGRLVAIVLAMPIVGAMLLWGWMQRRREDRRITNSALAPRSPSEPGPRTPGDAESPDGP
jgi:hypothetical protein